MKARNKNPGSGKSINNLNSLDITIDGLIDAKMNIRKSKRDIILNIRLRPEQLTELVRQSLNVSRRNDGKEIVLVPDEVERSHDSLQGQLLTKRESEILKFLAKGMLNKQIANDLGVSVCTVKNHLRSIYNKLCVENRAEAIIRFLNDS